MQQQSETAAAPARPADKEKKAPAKAIRYPFWFGGSASSMAACVTHPLDLVKVRLQMRHGDLPKSMSGTFAHVVRNDGFLALYNGLSASLLRQITYSTVRFGLYEEMKGRVTAAGDGRPPSFPALVVMASTAGFAGGVCGNVADVLNVRMQHDAALPPERRRNYRHAVDGLVRMAREEGLGSWFRGVLPNSMRAAAMTASQLASYDTFKGLLMTLTPMEDNLATHFAASFLAGVMAATVTSPIDVIKTRVMSAHGKSSLAAVIAETHAQHGIGWVFRGWLPSFLRLGPHTICTFVFLEMHRKVYRTVKGIDE